MICSKEELLYYLEQDKRALGITKSKPDFLGDRIWKFQIIYRKYEYARNVIKSPVLMPYLIYLKIKFERLSIKYGYSIPINVFGPGLSIAHYGTIVINGNARIGKNCRIQENVTIGATNGSKKAPVLGDNIFIGSGAKVIGDIQIENDIAIGAGSVVVRSVNKSGVTIAGVPAKIISPNSSKANLSPQLFNGAGE